MRSHVRSVGATGDRSERFTFALNFPGALLTATLILFPLGLVLFLSLRVNDGALLNVDLTLSNLITALADPLYQRVIARSLLIAGLVTLATVVTAYPVAYTIAFHGGRYKALLLFLVSLPFWTSYLLRVFAWKIVLAYNGVLNSALVETRLIKTPLLILLDTPAAVVVTLAHAYAAFAILPIYIALESIQPSLFEAAADLGARGRDTFLRVTLPLSVPGRITKLHDQHAYLGVPASADLAVGDLLGFAISHPCTTFDKWSLLMEVADDYTVIGGLKTFF